MAVFELSDATLRRLLRLNGFAVPEDGVMLFGLRGCLPINEKDYGIGSVRTLETMEHDYRHPRCTLGVWSPHHGGLACFAGSTVPYVASVQQAVDKGGDGANQLVPSFVRFRKGLHPRNNAKPQHPAFLQDVDFPVQRTADDLDYDLADRFEIDRNMGDNLHCGSSQGSHQPYFSSFGCQVLCGTARRSHVEGSADSGGWPAFRDLAYGDGSQQVFPYALLTGRQAQAAARTPAGSLPMMVRYGSSGELVEDVQNRLKARGFDTATQPGRFGKGTSLAVRSFQQKQGMPADGVVGPDTGTLLGFTAWPTA